MGETDRAIAIGRDQQPEAVEVGLGQHELVERRGGHGLHQTMRGRLHLQTSANAGGSVLRKGR